MKHLLIVIISVLTVGLSSTNSIAQDTWDIEGTILTEYDLVTGLQVPWEILWGADVWANIIYNEGVQSNLGHAKRVVFP